MPTDQQIFKHKYGPWALIAGASEGIGKSFAEQLAAQGLNLILLARRDSVLQETAAQIRSQYAVEVETRAMDLTGADLEQQLKQIIAQHDIGLLIYNAGATHGVGLFLDQPMNYALNLVHLNCIGPVVLAHTIGSQLRKRGRGGIILLSSMSALAGTGYVATYAATKSFDMIFAEGLWAELRGYGVDVLGLVAGATQTPAMQRSGAFMQSDDNGPAATSTSGDNPQPNILAMHPDDVACEALAELGNGPILFPGEKNRAAAAAIRSAPRAAAVDAMSGAAAGMYGKPWPVPA
jgi:short-subunit dehydrogenase